MQHLTPTRLSWATTLKLWEHAECGAQGGPPAVSIEGTRTRMSGGGRGKAAPVAPPVPAAAPSWQDLLTQHEITPTPPAGTPVDAAAQEAVLMDAATTQLAEGIDAVRKSDTFTGSAEQMELFSSVLRATATDLPPNTRRLMALQASLK